MTSITLTLLNSLKISDPQTIADIIVARKLATWTAGHSARVQAQKQLNSLSDLGKITKCTGFYRALDCKSEFSAHSRLLTQALAQILKTPYNPVIYREHTFTNGLRSDAVILLKNNTKACCFILEVCHTETYEYLKGKYDEWLRWEGSKNALTQLFGYKIPHFGFVVEGKETGFSTPLKEVLKCAQ